MATKTCVKTPFWANNHSEMYMNVLHNELVFPEDNALGRDTRSFIRGVSIVCSWLSLVAILRETVPYSFCAKILNSDSKSLVRILSIPSCGF